MIARKTHRGLDGYDQYRAHLGELLLKIVWMYVNPAGNLANMAIFTENPARVG